jgi:hypothetical protein
MSPVIARVHRGFRFKELTHVEAGELWNAQQILSQTGLDSSMCLPRGERRKEWGKATAGMKAVARHRSRRCRQGKGYHVPARVATLETFTYI